MLHSALYANFWNVIKHEKLNFKNLSFGGGGIMNV